MASIILRRIAPCGWFFTLLVFAVAVSVASPLPLLAQFTPQPQDLGPTNAGQTVTASLVLKVQHPDLLEHYVASTQDPNSPSYHRFLSLPSFVFNFAPVPSTYLSSRNISSCSAFR
jgi:subtilase family serine protease